MPTVLAASPSQIIADAEVLLWAEVESVFPVDNVWAVLVPPDYDPGAPGSAHVELPMVQLVDTNGDNRFEALSSDFIAGGEYLVSFYVMNELHEVSLPMTRTITTPGSFPWIFLTPLLEAGRQ